MMKILFIALFILVMSGCKQMDVSDNIQKDVTSGDLRIVETTDNYMVAGHLEVINRITAEGWILVQSDKGNYLFKRK